jgi:hypothetical protein
VTAAVNAHTHEQDATDLWCNRCLVPWKVRLVEGAPLGGCLAMTCPGCGGDYRLRATPFDPLLELLPRAVRKPRRRR